MSVADRVAARGVTEVVHFTTSHGCLGTLYVKACLSRERLQDDEMVKYLFAANAKFRKDQEYLDYVSLSFEHINADFFAICSGSWHRDEPIFWCILAFDPTVLSNEGVIFTTANNMYTSVLRGEGEAGLDRLFADRVVRWSTTPVVERQPRTRDAYPTDPQAEALYPARAPTTHLRRIYVQNAGDQSEVIGFLKATVHPPVDVMVAPDKFGERPA